MIDEKNLFSSMLDESLDEKFGEEAEKITLAVTGAITAGMTAQVFALHLMSTCKNAEEARNIGNTSVNAIFDQVKEELSNGFDEKFQEATSQLENQEDDGLGLMEMMEDFIKKSREKYLETVSETIEGLRKEYLDIVERAAEYHENKKDQETQE